jgi:hypothetical protein
MHPQHAAAVHPCNAIISQKLVHVKGKCQVTGINSCNQCCPAQVTLNDVMRPVLPPNRHLQSTVIGESKQGSVFQLPATSCCGIPTITGHLKIRQLPMDKIFDAFATGTQQRLHAIMQHQVL